MIAEKRKVRGEGADQHFESEEQGETKRLGGLVLARQLGQSVMIGDSVMVEVVGLKSNSVRLRIVAPRTVAVHRREVYDAIRLSPDPESTVLGPGSTVSEISGPIGSTDEGGLVLTRRGGQTIMIGGEVAVDVVEARPGTVRLRVIAPRSIAVHRREVYDAIRAAGFRDDQGEAGQGDQS